MAGEFKTLNEVNYTVGKRLGVLGYYKGEATKEVTLGKWNGEPRLDIRRWHGLSEIGKGISLTAGEVRELRRILAELDFGK